MISLKQAYAGVSKMLGDTKVSKIMDAGYFWIFEYVVYSEDSNIIVPGNLPYAVNKSDGKIWYLPIPPQLSKEQRDALNNAREVPIPE